MHHDDFAELAQHPGPDIDRMLGSARNDFPDLNSHDLLRCLRLMFPQLTFDGTLTFANTNLDAVVLRSGSAVEEVAKAWSNRCRLDAGTIAVVPVRALIPDASPEAATIIARVLCRQWIQVPLLHRTAVSLDDGERSASQTEIPFHSGGEFLKVIDTNSAGTVIAYGEDRSLAFSTDTPQIETACHNTIYVAGPLPTSDHLRCLTYSSNQWVQDRVTGDHTKGDSTLEELVFRRSDLEAFALELRGLSSKQNLYAYLPSQPAPSNPEFLESRSTDSRRLVYTGVDQTSDMPVNQSNNSSHSHPYVHTLVRLHHSDGRVELESSRFLQGCHEGAWDTDSVRILDYLATQIDHVLNLYPPLPGIPSSPRPEIRDPNVSSAFVGEQRVFPSFDNDEPVLGQ